MLVKIASGLRKDQVQDLAPAVAHAMVADGRAVLAFPDQFPVAVEPAKPAPVKVKKGRNANN
jgi:hypothetical protein